MAKAKSSSSGSSSFPADLQPMLATLAKSAFHADGWIYEVKLDGFRAMAYINKGKVELRSRNNKSFNEKFYPVYQELSKLKSDMILDGEIIVVNEKGIADFSALQAWRSEADGDLIFYAFDILYYKDKQLFDSPLIERRQLLKKALPKSGMIRLSESFDVSGTEFFSLAEKMGLEGIIAKKKDSKYLPGIRSKDWLKIKTEKSQEAVIGGYTINEGTPKPFSSLLLGIYEEGKLMPISPVGTGFNVLQQIEIIKKLKPLVIEKCPFAIKPDFNKPSRFRPNPPKAEVVWVKPMVVAEIVYRTVASGGEYRHPSFKGLREDKDPKEVKPEIAQEIKPVQQKNSILKKHTKRDRLSLLNPKEETQMREINGHQIKFTNLSKVFWPGINITKRDLLNYYYKIAPYIIPHLTDRPQTLNRFPNGIDRSSFYQKDVKGKVPSWIDTFKFYSETDKREKEFIISSDEASLLYIANLGCIEMNPWSSRKESPDNPDWCIIDLDPDNNKFEQVIEAAQITHALLDHLGLPSYCKTSGSTGLHIYIPLGAKYTYEDSKEFARSVVTYIHRQLPGYTSIERLTSKRKGKLYLDFLQNRPQATVASVYSLRPRPNATVSMPVPWEDVKKGLTIKKFTIRNSPDIIKEQGDLFKPVLGKSINIEKAWKILKEI